MTNVSGPLLSQTLCRARVSQHPLTQDSLVDNVLDILTSAASMPSGQRGEIVELAANLATLRAVSQDVATLYGDISEEWSTITKRAEDLFGVSWSGTAANSYEEPWAHCCEGVDHVLNGLATTGQLLLSATQTYAASDTSGAKVIESSPSYMPLRLP
ncbi:WXG100 family type VII secretion target [Gordonia sp. YY1]|uniref:WXG100 family type VII secretion target n=1 Tax=Gordonia sp. YY1 TaxID=396712 RepID=UPI0013A9F80F|nr:WXG100 family type VII secretion target [Gordonia sp. YY1]KAF0969873.1 hypothetical protein BPODLACK_01562 [Gordonia sp. YY1]